MPATLLHAAELGDVEAAAEIVALGGVAVFPTDTLYGIAASIRDRAAVDRVFEAKRLPPDRQVPWLVPSMGAVSHLVGELPEEARVLGERFWPGGLTLVLPVSGGVPGWVSHGSGTIGVRVPASRTCLALLQLVGGAVTGTSANISGSPPAATAAEAMGDLGAVVDAILEDDASVRGGDPSTVVDLSRGVPVILRHGAISASAIFSALGRLLDVSDQDRLP
jgi:L-threonylcarbamoyladenylate synthase